MQAELEIEPIYKHEERVNYRVKALHGVSDVLSKHRQFKKGLADPRPTSSANVLLEQLQGLTNASNIVPSSLLFKSASTESINMDSPRDVSASLLSPSPKTTPRSLAPGAISSPRSSVASSAAPPPAPSTPANSYKYLLDASMQATLFRNNFRLPSTESVLYSSPARIWYISAYVRGMMHISPRFICFQSPAMPYQLKLILPLYTVKSFSEPNAIPGTPDFGITFQTDTGEIVFVFDPPSPQILWKKLRAVVACLDPTANIAVLGDSSQYLKLGFGEGEVFKRVQFLQFGPEYLAQQKRLEKKWWKYFASHGIGTALIQRTELLEDLLTKGGIPDSIRGSAWKLLSGVTSKALADPMTYEAVVATVRIDERPAKEDRVTVEHIIELDLRRSMPEHSYYKTDEGIDALRRVLTAYAYRNPLVSYCQGMNFITSALLLYMSEADAFWTLAYICEDVFPELWRPLLFGVRVVQESMEQILRERLPAFLSTSADFSPTLAMLTWIPTFLVGRVPLEYSLRMLDHIFLYGADSIYWVLYSTFDLMAQDHNGQLTPDILCFFAADKQSYLDTTTHPFERIFQYAFSKKMRTEMLPPSMLRRLESEAKMRLVHELRDKARKKKIQALTKLTNGEVSVPELEALYAKYHEMLNRSDSGLMSFEDFSAHYSTFFPMWHPNVRMFRSFQASMVKLMSNGEVSLGSVPGTPTLSRSVSVVDELASEKPKKSEATVNEATVDDSIDDTESVTSSLISPATPSKPTSPEAPAPEVSIGDIKISIQPSSPEADAIAIASSTSASSISSAKSTAIDAAVLAANWNFVRDLFILYDTNTDGYLSIEEWVQGLVSIFKNPGPNALRVCLQLVDLDGDGHLSPEAQRCAVTLFLLLFVLRTEKGDQVEAVATFATQEKVSEWISVVSARASTQFRTATLIDDIVACSFGEVLNIYTFFQLQPTDPWKNFLKAFTKIGPAAS